MSLVLIVDDVHADRSVIGRVVAESGHQAVYAANGKEAVQAARLHRPRLILVDVLAPEAIGGHLCRSLQTDAATAEIPVVLVTSRGAADELRAVILRFAGDDRV